MNVLLETRGAHERRWKRYPTYMDSGVGWLGAVPEGWDVKRLKYVTECLDGQRVPLNAEERGTMQGEHPYWGANGILDYIDRWLFDDDLVLLGEDGAPFFESNKDVAFFVTGKIWVNNHAHILRAVNGLDGRFLTYCLNTGDYHALIYGSTRDKLTQSNMNEITVQFPADSEQHAIAAFLDRETGRIDALIAKKERQVELLQEKRTALISHAVTNGLDPDAPIKDSGVEWLGEVPEHWTFLPLKRNWQVTDCKHKTVSFIDEGVPVASIGEVQDIDVDLYNAKMTTSEEYKELIDGGRKPKRGDIIYSRNATVGAAAFVNTDIDFCMGQDVCLISSKTNNQRFLVYQLRSPVVMNQLESLVVGATFKRINVAQIKNFLVACPSQKEQDAIAIHCDKVTHRNDIFIAKVRESITKLREYRTAIISAAVTGKIDVREELVS